MCVSFLCILVASVSVCVCMCVCVCVCVCVIYVFVKINVCTYVCMLYMYMGCVVCVPMCVCLGRYPSAPRLLLFCKHSQQNELICFHPVCPPLHKAQSNKRMVFKISPCHLHIYAVFRCTCLHVCEWCVCVYLSVCKYVICMCVCLFMCVCVFVCIYIYIYIYMCVCVCCVARNKCTARLLLEVVSLALAEKMNFCANWRLHGKSVNPAPAAS